MRSKMSKKGYLPIVLTLLAGMGGNAKADFIFGESINSGSPPNTHLNEVAPSISADSLEIYFSERDHPPYRSSGRRSDLWISRRQNKDDSWGYLVNLGSVVNSTADDVHPSISADGLSLYYSSNRADGSGLFDLWFTTRETKDSTWGNPMNLGSTVNSSKWDICPCISPDGLLLFFGSNRSGGSGSWDLYMARRATTKDPWGQAVNLGSVVNSTTWETGPKVSPDGSVLYFQSPRSGGLGGSDIWQVTIEPVVDLNSDGIVDAADMCIIVDHWGEDYPLCDIGPMPWGDGIVDVQDLIVLAEHLFEEVTPTE